MNKLQKMNSIYKRITSDSRLDISMHSYNDQLVYQADDEDTDSSEEYDRIFPLSHPFPQPCLEMERNNNVYDPFAESCIGCCEGDCKEQSEMCLIETVFLFSYLLHAAYNCCRTIYNSSNCVKGCVSVCENTRGVCLQTMTTQEPDNSPVWISECWMTDTFEFCETYCISSEKDYNLFLIYKDFLDISVNKIAKFNTQSFDKKHTTPICDCTYENSILGSNPMILMKSPHGYFCNITETSSILNCQIPKRTNVLFLTIEYINGSDEESISIDIPPEYYMCGNELFTPIFVYRQLKYTGLTFHFSMDYIIRMIDSNLNMVELNSRQYMEIQDNEYIILDLPIATAIIDEGI